MRLLAVERRKAEFLASALLAGLGAFVTVSALRLPPSDEAGVPGSGTVPALLGAAIIAGAVLMMITAVRKGCDTLDVGGSKQGIALAGLMLGAALFEPLGFMLATTLLLAAGYRLLGGAPWRHAVPAAALVSGSLWLVFTKLLGVGLPYGLIGEVLFR